MENLDKNPSINEIKKRANDNNLKLAIFENIPMPVWACTPECKIVFWNNSAERLYNYTKDEALGRDFVNLFVNEPERKKARNDAKKIVNDNMCISNMADDIDKHGRTKRLITHCFPIYNVAGYKGLQVEISYEIKDEDINRLRAELQELQEQYTEKIKEGRKIAKELFETTKDRTLNALSSVIEKEKSKLNQRENAILSAKLIKDRDEVVLKEAEKEIVENYAKIVKWEQKKRKEILLQTSVEKLDELELSITKQEGLFGT